MATTDQRTSPSENTYNAADVRAFILGALNTEPAVEKVQELLLDHVVCGRLHPSVVTPRRLACVQRAVHDLQGIQTHQAPDQLTLAGGVSRRISRTPATTSAALDHWPQVTAPPNARGAARSDVEDPLGSPLNSLQQPVMASRSATPEWKQTPRPTRPNSPGKTRRRRQASSAAWSTEGSPAATAGACRALRSDASAQQVRWQQRARTDQRRRARGPSVERRVLATIRGRLVSRTECADVAALSSRPRLYCALPRQHPPIVEPLRSATHLVRSH